MPDKCTAEDRPGGRIYMDCERKGYNVVPRPLPQQTTHLNLANNNIKLLQDYSFEGCSYLITLDLSHNLMENISQSAFEDLGNLETLYLNSNQLIVSQLPRTIFSPILKIETLYISYNTIEDNPVVDGDVYSKLSNLRYLELDGHPNASFSGSFGDLQALQILFLKGNQMYVNNSTFKCFNNNSQLQTLGISSNLIDLDLLSFSHFSHLETLNLSNNPFLGFTNMSKSWYGLKNTQIQSLILVRSVPYDFQLITVDEYFTKYLNDTYVKKIVLDGNNILVLDAKFRLHTRHLEYLSVEYNRLVQVELLMCDIYYLKNLTYFSAACQDKRMGYVLSASSHRLGGYPSLSNLNDTCNNKIFNFSNPTKITLPPKLEYVNISSTLTESIDTLNEVIFLGKLKLHYLNYAANGLRKLNGPIYFAHKLDYLTLDLSQNDCNYISPQFFGNIGNVIDRLYLNQNKLGDQFINEKNCSIFKTVTAMTELHLAFNVIKTLPWLLFINQSELKVLNMSHNSLQILNVSLNQLQKLEYLDLSYNLLTQLASHYTQLWLFQPIGKGFSIDLQDNPLVCSCESTHFLRWIMETKIFVKHWKTYTCTYNMHLKKLAFIKDILKDLNIECNSKQWIMISSVTFGLVAFILALTIALYRHKYEVKIVCLKLTYQWKQYQPLLDTRSYEYDAFVAFHESDLGFVVNEMVPNLEKNDEFKLCIHHRDFTVGANIEENILVAIEKSRKTILILSENFLLSNWCDFEYEMARVRGFDEGVDIIVPVIKTDVVNVKGMSRSLRSLLKRNTYIEWPKHPGQVEEFWDKLRTVLKRPQLPLIHHTT